MNACKKRAGFVLITKRVSQVIFYFCCAGFYFHTKRVSQLIFYFGFARFLLCNKLLSQIYLIYDEDASIVLKLFLNVF